MKTLFITHHYLQGNSGGCYASRAYINAFAELSEHLTLLYPIRPGKIADGINFKVTLIPVLYDKNKVGKLFDLFIGRIHRYSRLEQLVNLNSFDIVVFDTSVVSFHLIDLVKRYGCKTLCIHHNYQYEYFRDNTFFPMSIPVLYWCMQYEREAVRKSDMNLTLTNADSLLLAEHYNNGNTENIHLLGCFEYERKINERIFDKEFENRHRFLITGNLSAVQTEKSLLNWIKKYYPILQEECPDAQLTVAGHSPSKKLQSICEMNKIRLIPSPSSISKILEEADVYICPVQLGGGLKLRIMDGLSHGLPVLTHQVSARGYEQFEKHGMMFVYDNMENFRGAIRRILVCNHSRQDVIDCYNAIFSFDAGLRRLKELLNNLLN